MESSPQYQVRKLLPARSISGFVDSYWFIEAPAPATGDSFGTMFPLGYPMIEFNLADRWIKEPLGSGVSETISSNITGFTTSPFMIRPLGVVKTAVARLHPLAVRKILGDDIRRDTVFDPHLVFGKSFRDAEERVANSNDHLEMKTHLDVFFGGVFGSTQNGVDLRVAEMMERIIEEGGTTNVIRSAREIGISTKRIEQLFAAHTGMTPKSYAGIVRFQKVIAAYRPGVSFTDLAQDAGYYDQSHFNRHFRKITDRTSKEFFSAECIYTAKITNLYNYSRV